MSNEHTDISGIYGAPDDFEVIPATPLRVDWTAVNSGQIVTPIPNYNPGDVSMIHEDFKPAFEIFKELILQQQKENPSELNREKIKQFASLAKMAAEVFSEDFPAV